MEFRRLVFKIASDSVFIQTDFTLGHVVATLWSDVIRLPTVHLALAKCIGKANALFAATSSAPTVGVTRTNSQDERAAGWGCLHWETEGIRLHGHDAETRYGRDVR